MPESLSALLVDPSIYTGPYDAALTEGLRANGVSVRWAARRAREGEDIQIPPDLLEPIYGGQDGGAKGRSFLFKARRGGAYLAGSRRLLSLVRRTRPGVLHVQWPILPMVDAAVMRRARRTAPVILTVHDLVPFNGAPASRLQLAGFDRALGAADRLIVHTGTAGEALVARGFEARRIAVIPHGPLRLSAPLPSRPASRDPRWTVVLFGKLQAYKGLDLLAEAAARLEPASRAALRIIVAGEPLMPMAPLLERIAALDLSDTFEFRLRRQSDAEVAALFSEADAFVFPYRQIEASGVFALVRDLGKWIVASDLGAFSDALADGTGALVAPGDVEALAAALADSIGRTPPQAAPRRAEADWEEIGRLTREVYLAAMAEHGREVGR